MKHTNLVLFVLQQFFYVIEHISYVIKILRKALLSYYVSKDKSIIRYFLGILEATRWKINVRKIQKKLIK